jgi:hypothetical protein
VIGDDLVIGGVVYDSNVYAPDGEGGVAKKTPAPGGEYPDDNAADAKTPDTPHQTGGTRLVTPQDGKRSAREARPGTPGTRHAAFLPPIRGLAVGDTLDERPQK